MTNKKWDDDIVHFSRRTRRGSFVLLAIFLMLTFSSSIYFEYFQSHKTVVKYFANKGESKEKSDSITVNQFNQTKNQKSQHKSKYQSPASPFDPNDFSENEWKELGLSEKQIATLMAYKASIGGFKSKEDLSKAYAISEDFYKLLEPFLDLPDNIQKENKTAFDKDNVRLKKSNLNTKGKTNRVNNLDLNTATLEDFQLIYGIGKYRAELIIQFREKLGGFTKVQQLELIDMLPKEVIDSIYVVAVVGETEIKKIKLNLVSVEQLSNHPLISREMANSIIDLRTQLNGFSAIEQVIKSPLINLPKYKELKPYLDLE